MYGPMAAFGHVERPVRVDLSRVPEGSVRPRPCGNSIFAAEGEVVLWRL